MYDQNLCGSRQAIRLRVSSILSAIWLITSCASEDVHVIVPPPSAPGEEINTRFHLDVQPIASSTTRSLTFHTDGTVESDTLTTTPYTENEDSRDSVSIATRSSKSLSEREERKIQQLWVGQYTAQGARLASVYIPQVALEYVDVKLKASLQPCTVYLIANGGDLTTTATTEELLLKIVHPYNTSGDFSSQLYPFLMQGKWQGVLEGTIDEMAPFEQKIEMTRATAKLRFTYTVAGSNFQFTPSSLKVGNIPQGVKLIESETRPSGLSFTELTEATHSSGSPVFWYLPENIAGEATGANVVDSEKKKTGQGVTNATYIELTGDAVQNGHLYQNVVIRLYPGLNRNDYNIRRNHFYTIEIRLQGIDFSDQRITVGQSPEPTQPGELLAEEGSETSFLLKTQPGKPWSFQLPDWLSALVNGTSFPVNSLVSGKGLTTVDLKAATANPSATARHLVFSIDGKEVTLSQRGSLLNKGGDIQLGATKGATATATFSATKGLSWAATLSNTLSWQAGAVTSGKATGVGTTQNLLVQAANSNPTAQNRIGTITLKGGDGIGTLTQQVTVNQAASTLTGSTVNSIPAAGGSESIGTFTAIAELPWIASVATGSDWLALIDQSGTTTGQTQSVRFRTTTSNPSSSQRQATVSVRAGNTTAPLGPVGNITVNQLGATLTVGNNATVGPTASSNNTVSFTSTQGLSWNASKNVDWITLTGTTSGTANTTGAAQTVGYTVPVNPKEAARSGNITIKSGNGVTGTDANLTKNIQVTQNASSLTVSGNPTTLGPTINAAGTLTLNGTSGLGYSSSVTGGFLTLSGATSGTTNGANQSFTYQTASINPNSTARTGAITVQTTGGDISKTVNITQNGSTLTVSPTSANAAHTASSGSFTVNGTNGLPLTYSSNQSWLTLGTQPTPANGGNQTATYNVAENTGDARSGVITVQATGGNLSRTLTVNQAAMPIITLHVSPTSLTLKKKEGLPSTETGYVTITTDGSWEIRDNQKYVRVSPDSGTGNSILTVRVSRVQATTYSFKVALTEYPYTEVVVNITVIQ
ncbi:BACON domain-containing carbohydrate-binding protein [Parabacteroides sp. PF5-9]|uniref:BACON domain-containing protein n=1 Tax=Parabacteroides sp. PF5-9 TaxID=1742404 RepID=UPI002476737E|nr:BACON domain-containing carbohydrate-binding protein [Parabacteroides sp. PF5-9]MDH6357284.1 hypothetical protein [Parabacteroides sp. PF5-9]